MKFAVRNRVVVFTMELRTSEHPEPSHIHVPRPSRVAGRPAQLPGAELLALCPMPGTESDCTDPD